MASYLRPIVKTMGTVGYLSFKKIPIVAITVSAMGGVVKTAIIMQQIKI
ncbi:hypothetical protein CCACVL1_11192 [Corchorus capsularis]|uniref:Uncharacterized protein n=1 Tax=Corchorus capsularis TaxID=210143 RepID=A0A1R3IMJ7_COCAP|nr:hypothetical protein CCACVL1_11192 [Corchorus capsularis]